MNLNYPKLLGEVVMKRTILALSVLTTIGAQAQVSPLNNHQSTMITESEATSVWKDMNTSFESGSECFNRAMSWTYDINKKYGYEAKKILIHYSLKYNKELSAKWGFHIAPVYNIEGNDTVLDKGFQPWIHAPLSKQMWEEKFLIAGTEKLVKKRIKLKSKIDKLKEAIYDLDKSSEFYYESLKSKEEKLKELQLEMIDFKVTDADLKKQRPLKIEQTQKWINYLSKELKKSNSSQTRNSINMQLKFHKSLLQKVKTDLNYAAHIQCKKIKNIEELDFNLMGEWCYIQEVSQYYWGVPQLRQLNYGSSNIPAKSDLRRARREGAQFEQTSFDMNYVWAGRKQAFGSDYKKIWKKEYDKKESSEAVKEIDNIIDDIEDDLKDANKLMKKINKEAKGESKVFSYVADSLKIVEAMEKDKTLARKLMSNIYSVTQSVQIDDVEKKIANFNKANKIKGTNQSRLAILEKNYEIIEEKIESIKEQKKKEERRRRDREREQRRRNRN
jgi:hypothetical protein